MSAYEDGRFPDDKWAARTGTEWSSAEYICVNITNCLACNPDVSLQQSPTNVLMADFLCRKTIVFTPQWPMTTRTKLALPPPRWRRARVLTAAPLLLLTPAFLCSLFAFAICSPATFVASKYIHIFSRILGLALQASSLSILGRFVWWIKTHLVSNPSCILNEFTMACFSKTKTKQKITYMVFIVIDVCTTDWNDEWTLLFYNWIWIDSTHDRSSAMQQSLPAFPFLHLASVFPSLAFITHASGRAAAGLHGNCWCEARPPSPVTRIPRIHISDKLHPEDGGGRRGTRHSCARISFPVCITNTWWHLHLPSSRTKENSRHSQAASILNLSIWFRAKAKPRVKGFYILPIFFYQMHAG